MIIDLRWWSSGECTPHLDRTIVPRYDPDMKSAVSHDRGDETLDSKASWFQSLTIEQRLATFAAYYDLALSLNPDLVRLKDVPTPSARVRILECP